MCEGCRRRQREIDALRAQLDDRGGGRYDEGEFDDEEDLGEDEDYEEPSAEVPGFDDEPGGYGERWDPARSAGAHGGRLHPAGGAYSSRPARAFYRYFEQVSRGYTFGSDIARFAAGERFKAGLSPEDKGRHAISRFQKWG
jgi:hypothetical protein